MKTRGWILFPFCSKQTCPLNGVHGCAWQFSFLTIPVRLQKSFPNYLCNDLKFSQDLYTFSSISSLWENRNSETSENLTNFCCQSMGRFWNGTSKQHLLLLVTYMLLVQFSYYKIQQWQVRSSSKFILITNITLQARFFPNLKNGLIWKIVKKIFLLFLILSIFYYYFIPIFVFIFLQIQALLQLCILINFFFSQILLKMLFSSFEINCCLFWCLKQSKTQNFS